MGKSIKAPRTVEDYRALILAFVGSLTLADHMGDVSNDVEQVLKLLGVKIEWYEWGELGSALGKMGVTTLYGTSLSDDDEVIEDGEMEADDND